MAENDLLAPTQVAAVETPRLQVKPPSANKHPDEQYPTPPQDAPPPSEEPEPNFFAKFDGKPHVNFFQQFDRAPDAGIPGLYERARLNNVKSYYRDTVAGSAELLQLSELYHLPDRPEPETPGLSFDMKRLQKEAEKRNRAKYDNIIADLARWDTMQPWSGTLEGMAAIGGAFLGGMQSPESFLGWGAKGATMLARSIKAGVQQGTIQAVTDIPIQEMNIRAGIQHEYEPLRTIGAGAIGSIIGGGAHFFTGELLPQWLVKNTMRQHGTVDPSVRRPDEPAPRPAPAPEAAPVPEPAPPRAGVEPTPAPDIPPPHGLPGGIASAELPAPPPVIPEQATPNVHRVTTPSGQSVEVRPVVMEARDLITSSDAGYDPTLQPRDRSRIASQQQIREIAANLDPERLGFSTEAGFGAPIIGPDKMVESGNARVMAIRQAYLDHPEAVQRYRDWIAAQGLDVSGFEQPVVVRQRTTVMTPEERQIFTVGANQPATLTYSASERALTDARLITTDSLDLLRVPGDLGAPGNRDFIRSFIGKLPVTEQGAMIGPDGTLTSEGLTRVRNAVVASAFGDAPVLTRIAESTDDEIKSISNSLVAVAPEWAKLRADVNAGLVRADVEQTGALVEAVTRTADLRSRGQKLAAFLAQQDAFEQIDPIVANFMKMFYDARGQRAAGAQRITDALQAYATEARKVSAGGGLDLGLPPVSAEELQRVARERAIGQGIRTKAGVPDRGGIGDGTGAEVSGGAVPGPVPVAAGQPAGAAGVAGGEARPAGAAGAGPAGAVPPERIAALQPAPGETPEVFAMRTAKRLRDQGASLFDQREAMGQLRMAETPGPTLKEKLEAEAQAPLRGGAAGPKEGGLFDSGARDQADLFAPTKVAGPATTLFLRASRAGEAAARLPGESDKSFAKRVIDKRPMPTELPEQHEKYFNISDTTKIVPIADLISSKTDKANEQGAANGAKRMAASSKGEIEHRGPISVAETPDGKYVVLDGNGTMASVKQYGWKSLPVEVVDEPYKPGIKALGPDDSDQQKRIWAALSPIRTIDDLYTQAPQLQKQLTAVSRDIADNLNGVELRIPPGEHGGVKGQARVQEKIDIDKKAPGRINDVVRLGFAIDKPAKADDVANALSRHFEIADEGWYITAEGYFDRKILVRFPNGQVGEVQIWHPKLLAAKLAEGGKLYKEARGLPEGPRKDELDEQARRLYREVLDAAEPEWLSVLVGKGGKGGTENLASNSALETTRASMPTTELLAGTQPASSRQTQALPGSQMAGSPSQTTNVQGSVTVSTPDLNIGIPTPSGKIQAALAERRGGERLPGEAERPDAGIPEPPLSPQERVAVQSLQQQTAALADAIDFPLRQGRQARGTLGQFSTGTGVVRTKEIADFEVVAHEAGHAIENKIGAPLASLIQNFDHELAPLVSDPAGYPRNRWAQEGFAEYIRQMMGSPARMLNEAPGFSIAFRQMLERDHPDILRALTDASQAYRDFTAAPSVDAIGAVRRSKAEIPHTLWQRVVKQVQDEGFFPSIKLMLEHGYTAFTDATAPMGRAVREMALLKSEMLGGALVDLKSADNPEVLLKLFARAEQAGLLDLVDGVRPHHDVRPVGPSLASAIAKAIGAPSFFGRWDQEGLSKFGDYLIARRGEYLWRKYQNGMLQNPPVAFKPGDALQAMTDLERANPSFREASDMVHGYTRELLRKMYEGNLITRDLHDKLQGEEFYVPFMRDLSDRPLKGGGFGSVDATRASDAVKRIRGSTRDIIDPLESLMTQTYMINRAIRHNDIILALKRMATDIGAEGGRFFEDVKPTEAKNYKFEMRATIEKLARERGVPADDIDLLSAALSDVFGTDPMVGSFWRQESAGARGEPLVFYKEAGEQKVARVMSGSEGHAIYELLTALPTGLADTGLQMLSVASATMRAGVVTNPVYVLTNYFRDQLAVGILRPDYIPFISSAKGLVSELTQGEAARLYGYFGGVSAGAAIAPIKQAAEADLNALAKRGYVVNRVSSLHGLLEAAAVTEAGTRNSVFGKVYASSQRAGLSPYEAAIEAAFQATDASLNFGQRGSKTLAIVALTPFVNSWMVGMDKAWRTFVTPLARRAMSQEATVQQQAEFRNAWLAWTKMAGIGGALGAAWAALHSDDEIYGDAPAELKGTHFVTSVGNKIVVAPKPFELSIGFTAGEFAYQAMMKQDPRAAGEFAEAAWEVMKPQWPIVSNPLLKTGYEVWANKSTFTGRPLVPDRLLRLTTAEQVTDRTTPAAKFISKLTGYIPFAGEGMSPIKVDHAIGGLFGTWGRDMAALSRSIDPESPATQWEDGVFQRRFIKDPRRMSDITHKFWDYMGQTTGKYNQAVNTYDSLIKSFRDADANDFLQRLPGNERTYVTLQSAADERGKQAFSPDVKRLHPLRRAYDATLLLIGLQEEMAKNSFRLAETGENVKLDDTTRRDVLDNVRELAQKEMRNALVIMKEPGYTGRPLFETQVTLDKIRALSPQVADEIAQRYQSKSIYTTKAVASAWPQFRDEVLRNGSQADVQGLAFDAKGEGTEFEGETGGAPRVKRPAKRRVPIPPQLGAPP